ncbi:MAG TPA: arginine--tRNA ligase, partial [Phycisphaerae bacterium]|nr:arginine--tRNA ligase [Phycisphaerae bacterium]
MPNVQQLLEKRVTAAIRAAFPGAADSPALVLPAQDPRFGDYQANGVMGLAKRLGANPREVAGRVVEQLKEDAEVAEMAEAPEIAGPGFINFRLRPEWIAEQLGAVNRVEPDGEDRLGVEPAADPETVVVDYSAPNLAKEMHVGHLRSTIIGDALVRMLKFAGHSCLRQNHVGDWGTQFGMLVAYIERKNLIQPVAGRPGRFVVAKALDDLEALYREARQLFDINEEFAREARETVVRLQNGDPRTLQIWDEFVAISIGHCRKVYERLGVLLTDAHVRGESAYNALLPEIIKVLRVKGLLTDSEGARCVFLDDEEGNPLFASKDGPPLPLIVQKSDEGYLYATTDLAAIAFRAGYFPELPDGSKSPRADRILYVVDARQSLHFQMVFAVARAADFAPPDVALEHVAFGTMMGPDGKPFKTREGGTVKLMDLLNQAEERAFTLVGEKSPELSETERREIARIVGIGAVKYGDLAQNRSSDYRFDWDQMLSLAGNTAPYMQYAYARVRSIFRTGGHEAEARHRDDSALRLEAPEELALGKMLLRFPETLDRALEDYRPNILAAYLYDLAQTFTSFYEACPVLKSPEPVRA